MSEKSLAMAYAVKKRAKKYARGGMVDEQASGMEAMPAAEDKDNEAAEMEDADMVDRIMKKRGYSKGGMVANEDKITAGFEPNKFDDLALRDDLEFSYTGANSGDELGSEGEDERRRDIVERVMRSRAKKDRMPRLT